MLLSVIILNFQIFCIGKSLPQLPLQIEDAMRPEGTEVRLCL